MREHDTGDWLLSNVLLDELNKELERRGHRFVRYADDCNIYVSGHRLQTTIADMKPVLTGWVSYFRKAEVRNTFEELDQWIRRKLRCILWRQWKRPRTRARELLCRGLSPERVWTSAMSGRGPWWNTGTSHMNHAVPTRDFTRLSPVSLLSKLQQFQHSE